MTHSDKDSEGRSVRIEVRLNDEEQRRLTNAAKKEGLALSSWLRHLGVKRAEEVLAGA